MISFFAGFLIGAVVTLISLYLFGRYLNKKDRVAALATAEAEAAALEAKVLAEEADLQKAREYLTSVLQGKASGAVAPEPPAWKKLLSQAITITSKQTKLDKKNTEDLIIYNELELEKLGLLKSIIAEGQDPVITIRYNTGDEQMTLSQYVAEISKGLA